MVRPTPSWRMLAALGAAALALTACGDNSTASPGSNGTTNSTAVPKGDGELVIGTLLPQTGNLAFLGPPEFAAVNLAIQEINAAGGVLGKPVRKIDADSGDTSSNIASQSVDRLLGQNVDAIIGAAASGVSLNVIDKITGAGVVQFSPANTSPTFTTYDDHGLYFRTAPSDVLQGRVVGDLALADGHASIALLVLQDSYGEGLADNVEKSVKDGGGEIVKKVVYDPKAASFAAEVTEIKSADPDAIVLIAFDETKKIIPEMVKQGIGPKDKQIYFVDGNLTDYSADLASMGSLQGVKGTLPGAESGQSLKTALLGVDPSLKIFSYAPESYDATILTALAAIAAGSDSGPAIASMLPKVSRDGTKCTTFADCVALLEDGKDIDYDGASGPIELTDEGDPSEAVIGIYEYGADNKYVNLDYRPGKI